MRNNFKDRTAGYDPDLMSSPGADPQDTELVLTEKAALGAFIDRLAPLGVRRMDLIGVWVALKSKPAIIFLGKDGDQAGTVAAAIATAITDDRPSALMRFQGHPWWAVGSGVNGRMASAQERLTTGRLRAFLDEAALNQIGDPLCVALFNKISRAELGSTLKPRTGSGPGELNLSLFTDLAGEDRPLPKNLYLLASMASRDAGDNVEPSRNAALIRLQVGNLAQDTVQDEESARQDAPFQHILLATREFNPGLAWKKAPRFPGRCDPRRYLGQVYAVLMRAGHTPTNRMLRDAMLFLGNAWDGTSEGLYHEDAELNAKHAVDHWLLNSVLPRYSRPIRKDPELAHALRDIVANHPLPTSPSLLASLNFNLPPGRAAARNSTFQASG